MFKVGNIVKPISRTGTLEHLITARVEARTAYSVRITPIKGKIIYKGKTVKDLWLVNSGVQKSTNTKAYEIF